MMADLLEAQKGGAEPDDTGPLRLDAARITGTYPTDSFPGHAAWRDGDWKLHRIEPKEKPARFELYHLAIDAMEEKDLAESEPDRVARMTKALNAWLVSVVKSLNGADYPCGK
jgi:arylsulfatase A-like enzyme